MAVEELDAALEDLPRRRGMVVGMAGVLERMAGAGIEMQLDRLSALPQGVVEAAHLVERDDLVTLAEMTLHGAAHLVRDVDARARFLLRRVVWRQDRQGIENDAGLQVRRLGRPHQR